jgi:hypothetical protein
LLRLSWCLWLLAEVRDDFAKKHLGEDCACVEDDARDHDPVIGIRGLRPAPVAQSGEIQHDHDNVGTEGHGVSDQHCRVDVVRCVILNKEVPDVKYTLHEDDACVDLEDSDDIEEGVEPEGEPFIWLFMKSQHFVAEQRAKNAGENWGYDVTCDQGPVDYVIFSSGDLLIFSSEQERYVDSHGPVLYSQQEVGHSEHRVVQGQSGAQTDDVVHILHHQVVDKVEVVACDHGSNTAAEEQGEDLQEPAVLVAFADYIEDNDVDNDHDRASHDPGPVEG